MSEALRIQSRDNALLKSLRRLARDNTGYRREGRIWVEGEHLCDAAAKRGLRPQYVVYAETVWEKRGRQPTVHGACVVVLPDRLFADLSQHESPSGMGLVLQLDMPRTPLADQPSVILDRVQDAGNVGSILRSAAAFGFRQILALQGTAALWGPKVLRAGMGAHFALRLVESLEIEAMTQLALPILSTSPHAGESLAASSLPWPCAWVFGHEGQGVSEPLQNMAARTLRLRQPGGEESLNVAACAAICLHASAMGVGR